jgi:ABC-type polysaccharide/polyol phosphate transport system ATPase subunit
MNSPPSRLAPQHGGPADDAVAEFEALYRANVAALTAYFARRSADLRDLSRSGGTTVVLVTHDASIADQADRVLRLDDGQLI